MWISRIKVQPDKLTCRFPMDMLRYDRCSPSQSRDIDRMLDSYEQNGDYDGGEIELVMFTQTKSQGPTLDRWRSFRWTVTDVSQRKL